MCSDHRKCFKDYNFVLKSLSCIGVAFQGSAIDETILASQLDICGNCVKHDVLKNDVWVG
jgi:hypothetical protein